MNLSNPVPAAVIVSGLFFSSCAQKSPQKQRSASSYQSSHGYTKASYQTRSGRTNTWADSDKPSQRSKTLKGIRTTSYSHQENEPGAYGKLNAKGTTLRYGKVRSAAADWSRFPVGTRFQIVGTPYTYEIDDYGSALVGTNTIDLYWPTLKLMNNWGTRHVDIKVIEWGCLEKSASIMEKRLKYPHVREMYYSIPRSKR